MAGRHLSYPPSSMTYASVVSQESVNIGFLVAALKYLVILSGGIHNSYLNTETKEKLLLYYRDEWISDQGKVVVILIALYGLKSSTLARRNHLEDFLRNYIGF